MSRSVATSKTPSKAERPAINPFYMLEKVGGSWSDGSKAPVTMTAVRVDVGISSVGTTACKYVEK
jgi:hypothetical protein